MKYIAIIALFIVAGCASSSQQTDNVKPGDEELSLLKKFKSDEHTIKDYAAIMLYRKYQNKYKDNLAKYLVSKLQDPDYYFSGIDDDEDRHRHGGGWKIKDTVVYIRCPYNAILEIGESAIPYLKRMSKSKDFGARINAEKLLIEINRRPLKKSLNSNVMNRKGE